MADAILAQCGIYAIRNIINGKVYIGSSANIKKRWSEHKRELRHCRHHSDRLQKAYNKYGSDAFEFFVIEAVEGCERLLEREQFWIDKYRAADRNIGYNIAQVAGSSMLGRKHSLEARAKMSDAQKGRDVAQETRRIKSAQMMGHKVSDSARAKISAANLGRRHSDESRQKMSNSRTGRRHSESTIAKMKGKKQTSEMRAKVIAALRGVPKSDEHRAKLSAANMGKSRGPQPPEVIAKRVAATRATKLAKRLASMAVATT